MRRIFFFYALFFLFFIGCEQSSDTVLYIPQMTLECNSSNNAICSSTNFTCGQQRGFVYLTRSGCGTNGQFAPVAGGDTLLSCDNQGCSGTISSWTDNHGNPVNELISGSISICAYIDTDCSNIDNAGDLVNYDDSTIMTSLPRTINSWSTL